MEKDGVHLVFRPTLPPAEQRGGHMKAIHYSLASIRRRMVERDQHLHVEAGNRDAWWVMRPD